MPRMKINTESDHRPKPKKRGTKPGTKQARDYSKICPAEDCPRNGEPFPGTAKAVYCSQACNLREWRKRQAAKAEAAA